MGGRRFPGISDAQDDFMEGIMGDAEIIMKRRRQLDRQSAEGRLNGNVSKPVNSLEGAVPVTLKDGQTAPETPRITTAIEGPGGEGRF